MGKVDQGKRGSREIGQSMIEGFKGKKGVKGIG